MSLGKKSFYYIHVGRSVYELLSIQKSEQFIDGLVNTVNLTICLWENDKKSTLF